MLLTTGVETGTVNCLFCVLAAVRALGLETAQQPEASTLPVPQVSNFLKYLHMFSIAEIYRDPGWCTEWVSVGMREDEETIRGKLDSYMSVCV